MEPTAGRLSPLACQTGDRVHLAVFTRGVKTAIYTHRTMSVTESTWAPDSWRGFVLNQQPEWPDAAEVAAVRERLHALPPLVFAGEARALRDALGEAAEGRAFVLQAGDC